MRQFGILTTVSGLSGVMVLNNVTYSETVEIAEARDESGKVTNRKAYSKTTTVKGDGVLDTTTVPATAISGGETITIDSKSFLIESADFTQVNTDYAKGSFTATRKDDETLSAYAEAAAASPGTGATE